MKKKLDASKQIGQVPISGTQRDRVLRLLTLQRKSLYHVATVNPEFVIEAKSNLKFREALSKSDLNVADGWGVVLGLRVLGEGRVERITGVDLVEEMLSYARKKGKKVFLLGGRAGVAEKAALAMKRAYPGLIVGAYQGPSMVNSESKEDRGLTLAKIRSYDPDYLMVAYGAPWQDIWIEENRRQLSGMVAVGVGGTLDEWAGVARKCPKVVDKIGLKWLWRLTNEPWRWKRQLRLLSFVGLVGQERLKKMLRK